MFNFINFRLSTFDFWLRRGRFCNNGFVSRVLYHAEAWCLSFIYYVRCRTSLTTYPPGSGEQPSSPGIFGLSIHEVYPLTRSPGLIVSSYLTFSPLPRRSMAVVFCGTICSCNLPFYNPFPLGSMALCIARTFLSPRCRRQRQTHPLLQRQRYGFF